MVLMVLVMRLHTSSSRFPQQASLARLESQAPLGPRLLAPPSQAFTSTSTQTDNKYKRHQRHQVIVPNTVSATTKGTNANTSMATTRLRRTFAYPTESDSDDPPDLDEEHQEELLTSLQTQDEAASNLYRHLFLALPVLTSLSYIPTFTWASGARETFLAVLSVFVPALAAYILYFHPIRVPGKHGLRSLYVSSGRGDTPGGVKPPVRHLIVFGASLAVMLFLQTPLPWWAISSDHQTMVPGGERFRVKFTCCISGFWLT